MAGTYVGIEDLQTRSDDLKAVLKDMKALEKNGLFHKLSLSDQYKDMRKQIKNLQSKLEQRLILGTANGVDEDLIQATKETKKAIEVYLHTKETRKGSADYAEEKKKALRSLEALNGKLENDLNDYVMKGINLNPMRNPNQKRAAQTYTISQDEMGASVGGQMSSRLKIGEKGYFTEDSRYERSVHAVEVTVEEQLNKLKESITANEELTLADRIQKIELINSVKKFTTKLDLNSFGLSAYMKESYTELDKADADLFLWTAFKYEPDANMLVEDRVKIKKGMREFFEKAEMDPVDVERIMMDDELCDQFIEVAIEAKKTLDSSKTRRLAGIGADRNGSDRNVAMSEVANLLGSKDLLAESRRVELKEGEISKGTGVLMDKAKGIIGDKLVGVGEKYLARMTDHAMEQISDMMFLDYICANTDRHAGNISIRLSKDKGTVIGIQGIDNDTSFGLNNQNLSAILMGHENFKYISSNMKNKIMGLTEEDFTSRLFGYLQMDEISAAWKRVVQVQNSIKAGKYEEVETGNWLKKAHKPEELIREVPFSKEIKCAATSVGSVITVAKEKDFIITDSKERRKSISGGKLEETTTDVKKMISLDDLSQPDKTEKSKNISTKLEHKKPEKRRSISEGVRIDLEGLEGKEKSASKTTTVQKKDEKGKDKTQERTAGLG